MKGAAEEPFTFQTHRTQKLRVAWSPGKKKRKVDHWRFCSRDSTHSTWTPGMHASARSFVSICSVLTRIFKPFVMSAQNLNCDRVTPFLRDRRWICGLRTFGRPRQLRKKDHQALKLPWELLLTENAYCKPYWQVQLARVANTLNLWGFRLDLSTEWSTISSFILTNSYSRRNASRPTIPLANCLRAKWHRS